MKTRKEKMKLMLITILGVLVALVAIHHMNAQDLLFNGNAIMDTENIKEWPFPNIPSDTGEWILDTNSKRSGSQMLLR